MAELLESVNPGPVSVTMGEMSSVYLVGFMGSGKSAAAAGLAALAGLRAVDLDDEVERSLGRTVAEIFARDGEAAFRRAETRCLEALIGRGEELVVALGGGTFCSAVNRRLIAASGGVSVFLDLPWAAIRRRLPAVDGSRPLYDVDDAEALYDGRRPAYTAATIRVALNGEETPDEVARRLYEEVMCVS